MPAYVIGNFVLYCVINAFTPGPGNILALNTVTNYGWKKGKPLFFGIFTGYYVVQLICAVFVFGINPMLLQMINKRISVSIGSEISLKQLLENDTIQLKRNPTSNGKDIDVFQYIVDQTMHRPRDLIMFCQYIQKEIRDTCCTKIDYRTIKNAQKEFCYWLVNKELANEINPILPNVDEIYNLLRAIGAKAFSFNDFNLRFKGAGEWTQSIKPDKLIEYLYDVGILMNVNFRVDKSTGRQIIERRTKKEILVLSIDQ